MRRGAAIGFLVGYGAAVAATRLEEISGMLQPLTCPLGAPGVVTTAEVSLPGDALASCLADALACLTNVTLLTWGVQPASLQEQGSKDDFVLSAQVGESQVRVTADGGQPAAPTLRFEIATCEAAALALGPPAAYKQAADLRAAFGGGALRWSARAINLHAGWQDDLAGHSDGECQGNLYGLREYFDMMGDLSVEKALIANHTSAFSRASVWRFGDGFRFVLDGVVMSDTRDEHIYHEMLVQPALLAAEMPRHVLIIGGGEGATLREVLANAHVENVTMVEIDEGLVRLCQAHLGAMHRGSFESPKASLRFEDGAAFLRAAAPASFDAIIIDGIDFQEEDSYGNVLFAKSLYRDAFRVLRDGGVLAQYMSRVERAAAMRAAGFNDTVSFTVDVPSFFGAGARFTLAGKGLPEALTKRLKRRLAERVAAADAPGWAYLAPDTMAQGLRHSGRRLKGFFGGDDPGYASWGQAQRVGLPAFSWNRMAFTTFVMGHTRRRRGVWVNSNGGGCWYAAQNVTGLDPADGGASTGPPATNDSVHSLCESFVPGGGPSCHVCDECLTDACVLEITGCQEFLTQLYGNCMQRTNLLADILPVVIVAVLALCGVGFLAKDCFKGAQGSAQQAQLRQQRESLQPANGQGLGYVCLDGTYMESGQLLMATYSWQTNAGGDFVGSCTDADGQQEVCGKLRWLPQEELGQIAWLETRPGVATEAAGSIRYAAPPSRQLAVEVRYVSNYQGNTQGELSLRSRELPGEWGRGGVGQNGLLGFLNCSGATGGEEERQPLRGGPF